MNDSHINIPTFEFLPKLTKKAEKLIDWVDIQLQVKVTKETAITSGALMAVKGLVGTEVRGIVHHLRVVEKRPIASSGKGYYTAHTPDELQDTIDGLQSRINSIREVRTALVKTQRRMQGADEKIRYDRAHVGKRNLNQSGLFDTETQ